MGKSRAEYMRNYQREYLRKKREQKLKNGNVKPKIIARTSTQRSRDFRARQAANSILSQTSTADPTTATALPDLAVSHGTLRLPSLPFSPIPCTSTAPACHTGPAGIQPRPADVQQERVVCEDQTKVHVAKVYNYFEQEFAKLKNICGNLGPNAPNPLSMIRRRTALATGVSETTVLQILKAEEGRNADNRQEPPETDSSNQQDGSDDNVVDNEQSSNSHEARMVVVKIEPPEYYNFREIPAAVKVEPSDIEFNKALTVEVKIEPPEYYKELSQPDSMSLDVKTEPPSDVVDELATHRIPMMPVTGQVVD